MSLSWVQSGNLLTGKRKKLENFGIGIEMFIRFQKISHISNLYLLIFGGTTPNFRKRNFRKIQKLLIVFTFSENF